jgi:hypothetical protein
MNVGSILFENRIIYLSSQTPLIRESIYMLLVPESEDFLLLLP